MALALALSSVGAARAEEPLRIGEIRIQCLDVFAPEEEARGWIYRAASAIHIETQTGVIRRLLLFSEGDAYDPALLAQTERNLRTLAFLKSATVRPGEPHDGVVDIDVVTQDAWTLDPAIRFGREGGITTWGAGITERNVLGLGRQVGYLYDQDVQRTIRRFEFADPGLVVPYWSARLVYANNSDGEVRRVRIDRPFVSTVDRLAAQGLWDRTSLENRIYADAVVVSTYAQKHQRLLLSGGRALSAGARRAGRLTAGIDFLEDDFAQAPGTPPGVVPASREFRYVFAGWESLETDYLSENRVNRGERVEDFNLGTRLAAQVGVSPELFGAPANTFAVAAEAASGWRLGPQAFVQAAGIFRTRLDGGVQNAILSGTVAVVWKHRTRLPQTTVARIQLDRGWNLDQDVQFFADGDNGLRGYHLYAFEGNRRVIVNVEHRFFGGVEILQLFTLGAAVFVDTGVAVPPGEPMRFSSLKTDAGAGLRFGLARAARNTVMRLDLAYAFDEDPLGRRGWLLSFSGGQAF